MSPPFSIKQIIMSLCTAKQAMLSNRLRGHSGRKKLLLEKQHKNDMIPTVSASGNE